MSTDKKPKKQKSEWLQRAEYAMYRFAARRVRAAKPASVLRWGERLGRFGRRVLRSRDRIAMRNLQRVFPDRPQPELRRLLDDCWRHFGRQALSYIRLQQLPPDEVLRDVRFEGLELLRDAQSLDRGVIVISAHYGSWEVAALTMMSLAPDVRTVARRLDNAYLERDLTASRARSGAAMIDRRRAARALLKGLAEKAALVLLPDQAVLPREGVLVPFLGMPAWTTPAPARLALQHGSPIVFAFCIPDGTGHRLEFEELIRVDLLPPEAKDPVALTQRINDVISRRILARPELWLWMHDRWKGTGEREVTNA